MAGGSRQHHTKSRNACSQCKKRRVRCDCTGPRCSNCRRRGEICDFTLLSAPRQYISSPSDDKFREQQSAVCFSPVPQPASPDLEIIELQHYYETTTANSHLLTGDPEMEYVWRYAMPLAAQTHDFLHYSLIGLSALHRAHECPWVQTKYHSLALKYEMIASKTFRSVVESVNAENSNAVFGFAVIFAIFQFKHCTSLEGTLPTHGIELIIDAISSLRSSFALAIQHDKLFKQTCFGILPERVKGRQIHQLDENTEQALEALDDMNMKSDASLEDKMTCTGTIQYLRYWYSIITPYPKSWDLIFRWLMKISSEFVVLLKKGQPMALIILAHWCVPVYRVNPQWFINGWAETAVRTIASILPAPWMGALKWPVNELKLSGILEVNFDCVST